MYDYFIVAMTTRWYHSFLLRLPENASVLDVGIGTAASLIANKDIILERTLNIVGVDYDEHYVAAAANLEHYISVDCASIHDFSPQIGQTFEAVYFSGSFMIIRNKVQALNPCQRMLTASTGKFYFTQTIEQRGMVAPLVSMIVKPALKMVTSIDFGQVTYRDEFDKTLKAAGLKTELYQVLSGGAFRNEVLVIAQSWR